MFEIRSYEFVSILEVEIGKNPSHLIGLPHYFLSSLYHMSEPTDGFYLLDDSIEKADETSKRFTDDSLTNITNMASSS